MVELAGFLAMFAVIEMAVSGLALTLALMFVEETK